MLMLSATVEMKMVEVALILSPFNHINRLQPNDLYMRCIKFQGSIISNVHKVEGGHGHEEKRYNVVLTFLLVSQLTERLQNRRAK